MSFIYFFLLLLNLARAAQLPLGLLFTHWPSSVWFQRALLPRSGPAAALIPQRGPVSLSRGPLLCFGPVESCPRSSPLSLPVPLIAGPTRPQYCFSTPARLRLG